LALGDFRLVEGIIVAKDFSADCINFVNNYNQMGRKIKLIKFAYNLPVYNTLNITKII